MATSPGQKTDHGIAPLAWWLLPLALVITAIIFLFGSREPGIDEQTTVTALSPQSVLITLQTPPPTDAAPSALAAGFVPLNPTTAEQVLQQLRVFQTDYRQNAPAITVAARPGAPARDKLAAELRQLLARAQLAGPENTQVDASASATSDADIVVLSRSADREVLRYFIAALAPYFAGSFEVIASEQHSLDRLVMIIRNTPRFRDNGQVVLQHLANRPQGATAVE